MLAHNPTCMNDMITSTVLCLHQRPLTPNALAWRWASSLTLSLCLFVRGIAIRNDMVERVMFHVP